MGVISSSDFSETAPALGHEPSSDQQVRTLGAKGKDIVILDYNINWNLSKTLPRVRSASLVLFISGDSSEFLRS